MHQINPYHNPLFMHANDNQILYIVNFKLTETENYRTWSTPMKIGLNGNNKMGVY